MVRPPPPVVLFNDTFIEYHYPQIGVAAMEVLERAGFDVKVVTPQCCGRPMLSKGFLAETADNARANVDLLLAYAKQGVPIISCEASCIITLRDEYPDLLRDDRWHTVAR